MLRLAAAFFLLSTMASATDPLEPTAENALVEYKVNAISPLASLYEKEKTFFFASQNATITLKQDWGSAGTGAAMW
jgi:hypothetical protein